jgi:hypothetical protein
MEILASSVVRLVIMPTAIPRGMSKTLQASSIIVDRDPLRNSSSLETTTRPRRATKASRAMFMEG